MQFPRIVYLKYLLLLVIFIGASRVHAQFVEDRKPEIVSKLPVASEQSIRSELFGSPGQDDNYYLRVNLPDHNFLVVEFDKISYWPGKGALKNIVKVAGDAVENTAASFTDNTGAKRIDVHIPIHERPVTIQLTQHSASNLFVADGRSVNKLKAGMDTLNILKTFAEHRDGSGKDTKEEKAKVRYMFILKNLSELKSIADNGEVLEQIDHVLDSLVQRRRKKWLMDDAWYHALSVEYDATDLKSSSKITQHITGRFLLQAIDIQGGVGAGFIGGNVSPCLNAGINFKWPAKNVNAFKFVALSINTIAFIEQEADKRVSSYGAAFANIESGFSFKQSKSGLPLYQYSVGVGTKIYGNSFYAPFSDRILRLFINYSLAKSIVLTTEMYSFGNVNRTTNSNAQIMGGLTLSLRIF